MADSVGSWGWPMTGSASAAASVSRRHADGVRQSAYYQTEWPRPARAYEYGVYSDQVLQNYFMPGMWVLSNLSPA